VRIAATAIASASASWIFCFTSGLNSIALSYQKCRSQLLIHPDRLRDSPHFQRVVANQNHEGHQGNTKYSLEKPSCNLRVLRGFSFSFFMPLHLYVSDSTENRTK
jgi:hypothetical protein